MSGWIVPLIWLLTENKEVRLHEDDEKFFTFLFFGLIVVMVIMTILAIVERIINV